MITVRHNGQERVVSIKQLTALLSGGDIPPSVKVRASEVFGDNWWRRLDASPLWSQVAGAAVEGSRHIRSQVVAGDVEEPRQSELDDETWLNKGRKLEETRAYEDAARCYDEAVELDPEDFEAWRRRGGALFKLGQHKAALSSYDKARELRPEDAQLVFERALALDELGVANRKRRNEAIRAYHHYLAVAEAWQDSLARHALGRLGELELPTDELAAVSGADEGDAMQDEMLASEFEASDFNRASALQNADQFGQAAELFEAVIKANPDDGIAWTRHAECMVALGSYEAAFASYSHAVKIMPGEPDAHYGRGYAASRTEKLAEAANSFRSFLTIAAGDDERRSRVEHWIAHKGGILPQPYRSVGPIKGRVADEGHHAKPVAQTVVQASSSSGATRLSEKIWAGLVERFNELLPNVDASGRFRAETDAFTVEIADTSHRGAETVVKRSNGGNLLLMGREGAWLLFPVPTAERYSELDFRCCFLVSRELPSEEYKGFIQRLKRPAMCFEVAGGWQVKKDEIGELVVREG